MFAVVKKIYYYNLLIAIYHFAKAALPWYLKQEILVKYRILLILFLIAIIHLPCLHAQHLDLVNNRVTGVHNGNLIRTRFTNYGNLGSRTEKPNMEWPKGTGHEFGSEFVMFAGARITDESMTQYYIFTESSSDPYNLDENPTGTYTYSWQPLPGYYNTLLPEEQQTIAMSNIPASWPRHWIVDYPGAPGSRDGMWNGEFKAAPIADQESYYVMVDWNNAESAYYPFPDDSTKRGLGLQVKVRTYQWADPLAEDILISIYDITNKSPKPLRDVVFGMYADADVDGPLNDLMAFDPSGEINITYQWDYVSFNYGYFGFAFLESPGNDTDGLDNDEDGLIDESRVSGRGVWIEGDNSPYMLKRYGGPHSHWSGDEDGDWDARFDDTGSDGLLPGEEEYPGPDTDGTEGNGMPDDGEPNFDRTDLDESDQIGLTSFTPSIVNSYKLKDDQTIFDRTVPGTFEVLDIDWVRPVEPRRPISMDGNVEFMYGSGYFPLLSDQTERFSVAAVFGNDERDILGNKAIMQRIYDDNYHFAKPPIKPTLYAYAKDGQVILSWDSIAETSYDPIYGNDFEGYILYKATDPEFNEAKTITDMFGNPFFYKTIGQYDLKDGLKGPHPIAAGANISWQLDRQGRIVNRYVYYQGTGTHLYMGNDTGLQHIYIDNDVQNGRTYYYAVVAYDKGYDYDFFKRGLSDRNPMDGFKAIYPIQNSKTITQDVVGNIIFHDRNTAIVVPNAPGAGTQLAELENKITHTGPATGKMEVTITYPDSLKPGHLYRVTFSDKAPARQTDKFQLFDATENHLIMEKDYPPPSESGESIIAKEYEKVESGVFNGLDIFFENHLPGSELKEPYWLKFHGQYYRQPGTTAKGKLLLSAFLPTNTQYHFAGDSGYVDTFSALPNPYPSTIEIQFYDGIADTTISRLPQYRIPIRFQAFDVDDDELLYIMPIDVLQMPTAYHDVEVVILKKIDDTFYAMAQLRFFQKDWHEGDPYIVPAAGSVLRIVPSGKNFTSRDAFEFSVKAASNDLNAAQKEMSKIAVVPDPYIASASWEKPLYFTSGRGERRVDFIHLPSVCTIKIFTLDGKLVRTLEHHSPIEDGHHPWDLTSKDDLDVAPGIYIYHVDAPGVGEKMGRFALIK